MDQSLIELNQKVDALSAQIAFLAEDARSQQRSRQEMDEFKNDVTPIANELFRLSVQS